MFSPIKNTSLLALLILSACGQSTSSVSPESLKEAENAQTITGQILSLNNWAIQTAGDYVIYPNDNKNIDLLAENKTQGVILYGKKLAQKIDTPQTYIEQLQKQLTQNTDYQNPKINQDKQNIRYQFSYPDKTDTINESCLVHLSEQTAYLSCVYSSEQNFDFLNKQIHDIQTQP